MARYTDDIFVARAQAEYQYVQSWLPWLPNVGIQTNPQAATLNYTSSGARGHFFAVPLPYAPDDFMLRRLVRHESGHLWANVYSRRTGQDPATALGIPMGAPLRGECVAEIFARSMGMPPLDSYTSLTPFTDPTPARQLFIDNSGDLPNTDAAAAQLSVATGAFWGRSDIPEFFRTWAGNYQTWLDINVLKFLKTL